MKTILSLLCALFLSAASSVAQTEQRPFWMLVSPGAMKAYAVSRVSFGNAEVWGPTLLEGKDSKTYTNVGGSDVEAILSLMAQEVGTFRFEILDYFEDYVYINGRLNDETGYPLFSAWSQELRPVQVDGVWKIPAPVLKMHMVETIRIPVGKEFTSARLFYRDDQEQYNWTDGLYVNGGLLWFPVKYAGQWGQLVLEGDNGERSIVDITYGDEVPATKVEGSGASFTLHNYIQVSDTGLAAAARLHFEFAPLASKSPQDAPAASVKVTSARKVSCAVTIVDKDGNMVEKPKIMFYKNRLSGDIGFAGAWTTQIPFPTIPSVQSYFEVTLGAGDWLIWFETVETFNEDPQYPWYGGKG